MGIEAACTAALGSLHRLSVHDHYAGASRSSGRDSHLLVHGAVQLYPDSCSLPSPEIMVDRTPSWKVMRQQPLTAGAEMALMTARRLVVRGRPPGRAAGRSGATSAQASSVSRCRTTRLFSAQTSFTRTAAN